MDKNKLVAQNLRYFRKVMGYTQTELAEHIGVSYQQLQKYETAANRISAGTLSEVSDFLKIPVEMFYTTNAETDKRCRMLIDALTAKFKAND